MDTSDVAELIGELPEEGDAGAIRFRNRAALVIAILAVNRPILLLAGALGLIGALLTANGFLLLVPLPI